jgi:hypothetical protein
VAADDAVVVQEAEQVVHREVHDLPGAGRPDRGRDGHQEVVPERPTEAAVIEIVGERLLARLVPVEAPSCIAIEPHDLGDHAPLRWTADGRRRSEQAPEPVRAELDAALAACGAEGHLRRLGRHAELAEQAHEPGVGVLVVDDEPGVDGDHTVRAVDGHGPDMAPQLGLRLEQADVVLAVQEIRGRQATHARADHGDPHAGRSSVAGWSPAARSSAAARSSKARRMPATASSASLANARPRNGWTSRIAPPRRMSAV